MKTSIFAVATGLLCVCAVQGQMTEVPDPMYGCTDGAVEPAFRIVYPNYTEPISCGMQLSGELAQDHPLLSWAPALDYFQDCEDPNCGYFTIMLVNNDDALDGFCEAGGICLNPVYHHVLANIAAVDLATGIIPPGGATPPPASQTGPDHEIVPYRGPAPFAPGLVSPFDFRFHYSYIVFAHRENVRFEPELFVSGVSLADTVRNYSLTSVEQIYWTSSINGCDDGEIVCRPCPETNMVYFDEANSPDECTDLCNAPNYVGEPMLPEFVIPCYEVCARCETFETTQTSDDSSESAAASAGIAVAAVVAVAITVAGATKYWKHGSEFKHARLLDPSTLSSLDSDIAGARATPYRIQHSELASV
jgi:hypothetical protein